VNQVVGRYRAAPSDEGSQDGLDEERAAAAADSKTSEAETRKMRYLRGAEKTVQCWTARTGRGRRCLQLR
jgi:hypothetical protein